MKKYTFFFGLIWVLAICASSLKAQEISTNTPSNSILKENITFKNKRFYIGIQGGYNFVLTPVEIYGMNFTRNDPTTGYPMRISLGRGGQVGLNFGYMFNKYIGIELGASYLYTLPFKAIYSDPVISDSIDIESREYADIDYKRILSAHTCNVSLSIILTTDFKKWNPYLKFGLLVNGGQIRLKENIIGAIHNSDNDHLTNYRGDVFYEEHNNFLINAALGIGFTAAVGCTYNINSLVSIFAEWKISSINSLSLRSKVLEQEVKWEGRADEIKGSLDDPFISSSWSDVHTKGLPFSNTGLQIGIKFHL